MTRPSRHKVNDFRRILGPYGFRHVGRGDHEDHAEIYALAMPITGEEETISVDHKMIWAKCLPKEAIKLVEGWQTSRLILRIARDIAPLSGDLSPITAEEKQIFGVRNSHTSIINNSCLPYTPKFKRPKATGEFDYIYRSRYMD